MSVQRRYIKVGSLYLGSVLHVHSQSLKLSCRPNLIDLINHNDILTTTLTHSAPGGSQHHLQPHVPTY